MIFGYTFNPNPQQLNEKLIVISLWFPLSRTLPETAYSGCLGKSGGYRYVCPKGFTNCHNWLSSKPIQML